MKGIEQPQQTRSGKGADEVWTVQQAAEFIGVNVKTLYELFRGQNTPGVVKVGRIYRILKAPFLEAWAAGSLTSEEEKQRKSLHHKEVQR